MRVTGSEATRESDRFLAGTALTVAVWSLIFVWRTSFELNGQRVFCLFDDAMISMRYAAHVAQGVGLVFNPGERVEGFTNPLWVALMAVIHLIVREPRFTSAAVQLVDTGIVVALLWPVREIAWRLSGGRRWTVRAALLLVATSHPLLFWALVGMEVGAVALMLTWAMALALRAVDEDRPPTSALLLTATAVWLRPDAAVLHSSLALALFIAQPRYRRSIVATAAISLGVSLGAQTLARLAYFGDSVPNTYRLKMEGIAPLSRTLYGAVALFDYLGRVLVVPVVLPFIALLITRDRRRWILLLPYASQLFWTVWIGGDAWESPTFGANRFVAASAPAALILSTLVIEALFSWRALRSQGGAVAIASGCAFVLAVLSNEATTWSRMRSVTGLDAPHTTDSHAHVVQLADAIRRVTTDDATVAVTWAGAIPYFSDRRAVDLLGKLDPHIARLPMRVPLSAEAYRSGHMKWDYDWSIGHLKPDVVGQTWFGDGRILNAQLANYTLWQPSPSQSVYLRRDSPRIRWDLVGPTNADVH